MDNGTRKYRGTSSIERKEPSSLGDLIPAFIRAMKLGSGLKEQLVLTAWDKVTGAGPYTLSKYMKDGVLVCAISSSVIRNQLFFQKDAIVEAINKEVLNDNLMAGAKPGTKVLKSLILR